MNGAETEQIGDLADRVPVFLYQFLALLQLDVDEVVFG